MTRQVTDQLYIELDYFTPEEYYVYTAEAAVALSASATLDASVVRIKQFDSSIVSESTLACTISHIEGADLQAFTNASLSAQATVTKSTSATLSSEFAQIAGVGKIVQGSVNTITRTPKTITANGNAQVSTVQKKFGAGSIVFDGSGDYLTIPSNIDFAYGTGAFTIEMWVYRTAGGANQVLTDQRTAAPTNYAPVVFINASNALQYNDGNSSVITGATTVPLNAWSHVVLSRSGTSTRLFLNGVQQGSTYSDSRNYIQTPVTIGSRFNNTQNFNGFIDDLRISKGVARYTANFTAPIAAFVNDADTVLLVHGDTDITDDTGEVSGLIISTSLSAQADRTRDTSSTLTTEFTFLSSPDIITPTGELKEFAADLTSAFAQAQTVAVFKDMAADLVVESVFNPGGVERTRGFASALSTEFAQQAVIGKIVQGACAFDALFSPSMTVNAITNTFAVLDSTSALTTVVNANRSADIALSSIVNQSLQGDRLRGYVINATSQFEFDVQYVNQVPAEANLSVEFAQTTDVARNRSSAVSLSSQFAQSTQASRTRNLISSQSAVFAQSTQASRTKQAQAQLQAFNTQVTVGDRIATRDFFVTALDVAGIASANPLTKNTDSVSDSTGYVYSAGVELTTDVAGTEDDFTIILTKHTPQGHIVWQKALGTFQVASPTLRLQVDGSKLYVTLGMFDNGTTWQFRLAQLETSSGAHNWTRRVTFITNQGGFLCDTKVYNNVIYILTGSAQRGAVVHGFNASGTQVFESGVNLTGGNAFAPQEYARFDINSTGIYIALREESTLYAGGIIARLSLDGNTVTSRKVNQFEPHVIRVDSSGNMYVMGRYNVTPNNTYALIKLNSSFVYQWGKKGFANSADINNFVLNNDGNLVMYKNQKTEFVVLNTSGEPVTGGSLRVLNNVGSVSTTFHAYNIQVDAAGWLQVSGAWTRLGTSEFITAQIQHDLSEPAFVQPIIETFRDNTNFSLEWTKSYSFSATDLTETVSTVSATTSGDGGQGVTQPSTTVTDIAYDEIALFIRVLSGTISLTSTFAQQANNTRIRSAQATLSTAFTSATQAVKTARSTTTLSALATMVPNGGYIKGAEALLASQATVTAQPLRIKQLASQQQALTALSVQPIYFEGATASLTAETTISCNLGLIKQFAINLEAFNTQLTAVNKVGRGLIQLDVVVEQTTQAVKTVTTPVTLSTQALQTTQASVQRSAQALLQVEVQVQADNGRIKLAEVNINVQATANITTDLSRIRSTSADLALQAQVQINSVKTAQAQALLEAVNNLDIQAVRTRLAQAQLQLLAQVQAPAVKTARTQLTLQAFNTQLVSGQVLNYDPLMTIMVPREQRQAMILEETLLLMVKQESRVNMVRKIMQ